MGAARAGSFVPRSVRCEGGSVENAPITAAVMTAPRRMPNPIRAMLPTIPPSRPRASAVGRVQPDLPAPGVGQDRMSGFGADVTAAETGRARSCRPRPDPTDPLEPWHGRLGHGRPAAVSVVGLRRLFLRQIRFTILAPRENTVTGPSSETVITNVRGFIVGETPRGGVPSASGEGVSGTVGVGQVAPVPLDVTVVRQNHGAVGSGSGPRMPSKSPNTYGSVLGGHSDR